MLLGILYLSTITMISDVQLNHYDDYPDSVGTIVSEQLEGRTVYDCGDVVENGVMSELIEYARYNELFPASVPVPGNHDYYDGLDGWTWSTFVDETADGIHLVGLDTGRRVDSAYMAMAEAAMNDEMPTIVFLHHQIYSGNVRNGGIANVMRPIYEPLFIAAEVDLVVSGHGHAYERHEANGITYLVIGGAGAHLDPVSGQPTLITSASVHHWIEIDHVDGSLEVEALDLDGNMIDACTVELGNGSPTESTSWSEIKALFRP